MMRKSRPAALPAQTVARGNPARAALLARLVRQAAPLYSTSSLLAFARIGGALAGFVTQVVLARVLEASALGLFYSATSLAAVFGLIAGHGYPAIASRFMSRYREQGKTKLIAGFVKQGRHDALVYVVVGTALVIAGTLLWPGLSTEARWAGGAAALSIPANAAIRLNGAYAAAIRRFALGYLPDTCIRPFLLLGAVLVVLACGFSLSAAGAAWLLTGIFSVLALSQFILLEPSLPQAAEKVRPPRLIGLWRREATPLIIVALFAYFFADVDILIVTPLLKSSETAAVGLCLKLALLVGFAVQVAQQVVIPDLADAHARKQHDHMKEVLFRALLFPLAVTTGALVVVVLWGDRILGIFGPEFAGAQVPLIILMACQFARAVFGPNVNLLTVIGAQKENAALTVAALIILVVANVVLAPAYGVLGASIAVAIATLFWIVSAAAMLWRLSGLRTDAIFLLGGLRSFRSAPACNS